MNEPKTLIEAIRYFADPDVCLEYMVNLRWPDGVACPTCGSKDVRYVSTRHIWECKAKHTKRQFSVKVGTIFEDSPIALDKWLAAIWMIANAKNGVSSYEVARALDVTQKTAWFMLHRIRLAMEVDGGSKLSGTVEADETYIGGKARNMHKSKREKVIQGRGGVGKVAVMGLLQRYSNKPIIEDKGISQVQAKVIKDISRKTIPDAVRNVVEKNSELITDALAPYNDLNSEYRHKVIDHAEAYVRGRVHTNGIENFWSLLKRAIKGTYVNIEPFHLFRYLDEETFRFNTRKSDDGERFEIAVDGIVGKRLTYAELTARTATTPA